MTNKRKREIEQIEEAQAALRESIEATKGLAERAEKLLQHHKKAIERDEQNAPGKSRES